MFEVEYVDEDGQRCRGTLAACWNRRFELAAPLAATFATPRGLLDGVGVVGQQIAVLPVAFHLLWRQVLVADLAVAPLGPSTLVQVRPGAAR